MKKTVNVIIKRKAANFDKVGSIKKVRLGYAANYLIPNKIAEIATASKIKHIKMFENIRSQHFNEIRKKSLNLRNQLERIRKISIKKIVGEQSQIFGSISEKEILKCISKCISKKIQKKQVIIQEIKTLGIHTITIKVMDNILVSLKVQILPMNI